MASVTAHDVIRALLALADESQGGKTEDEMVADAIISHSNGYSFWFVKPGQLGTAPLSVGQLAARVERRVWVLDVSAPLAPALDSALARGER